MVFFGFSWTWSGLKRRILAPKGPFQCGVGVDFDDFFWEGGWIVMDHDYLRFFNERKINELLSS